jgi:3-oxoacyl-[acyl-carrier protein] reductase
MSHSLVVGGTWGIGRTVARRFAAEGHAVSVLGRRESPEEELPGVRSWQVDVADASARAEALAAAVRENGALRNVVLLQRFRGDGDSWQGELAVSVDATKKIVEQVAGSFTREGGSIVIAGSHASHLVADEQPIGYHVAKAALRQMARYLAVQLGPRGIRVNCVTPGAVLKEETADRYREDPWSAAVENATPLRRIGTADDVADGVVLLCSPGAGFITGHELVVDGGLSLVWQESLIRAVVESERT